MADQEESTGAGTFLGMKTSNAIIVAVLIIVIIGLIYFVFLDSNETSDDPEKEAKDDDKCLDKFNILEVVKKINSKQAKNLNKIKAPDI